MLDKLEGAIKIIEDRKKPVKKNRVENWIVSGWKADEVQFNPLHIIDEMEKLEKELYNDLINNRNTVPRPLYLDNITNIITLIGLTRSAMRDTAESTDSISHMSLGTSATTATEGDINLGAEVAGGTPTYVRKSFASSGQRKVINQTAKYGMLWSDVDIDVTPAVDIKEAGTHWAVSGSSNIHAHINFTTFTFDPGDLFVAQINEQQANA